MPSIIDAVVLLLAFGGPIFVYFDVRRWRNKGVPANPGVIASIYFFLGFIAPFLLSLALFILLGLMLNLEIGKQGGFFYESFGDIAGVIAPFACIAWYAFVHRPKLAGVAAVGNGPLPAPSKTSSATFVLTLLFPLFFVLLILGFIVLFWNENTSPLLKLFPPG